MAESSVALEFVRYVLEQVCENKSDIQLTEVEDDRGFLITVSVAEADMGRLIGREGQTVSAMRTLLSVISAKQGKRFFLKVD